ncbi:hypothetical protein [Kribbella sp. NPDC004875]|uniref:hypothetical protein n=1 Tax=Kribbella sp. NPDC004875 TaxID=3364107 RepID=UPI003677E90F
MAIDKAMSNPTLSSRTALEAAGLSDKRILDALGDVRALRDSRWYRTGETRVRSLTPTAVELTATQPRVILRSCVDFSATVLHFQKDHQVVPIAASGSKRVAFSAELRYTARSADSTKMWFLTDEKANSSC